MEVARSRASSVVFEWAPDLAHSTAFESPRSRSRRSNLASELRRPRHPSPLPFPPRSLPSVGGPSFTSP
eukprot:scaffold109674_cov18-Tisochrysis_lutea.AAC.1